MKALELEWYHTRWGVETLYQDIHVRIRPQGALRIVEFNGQRVALIAEHSHYHENNRTRLVVECMLRGWKW